MILTTDRYIDTIILHCSDTYPHMDVGAKEITEWHQDRGYSTNAYHFIIKKDGTIETGRNLDIQGAHCFGYNTNSIGICWVGGKSMNNTPIDDRTKEQKKALAALCINLQAEYPNVEIKGHNDFSKKTCPNFNVEKDIENFDMYLFF